MAKRSTGVGAGRPVNKNKTKKRLEKKRLMLLDKIAKHSRHMRKINPERLKQSFVK